MEFLGLSKPAQAIKKERKRKKNLRDYLGTGQVFVFQLFLAKFC